MGRQLNKYKKRWLGEEMVGSSEQHDQHCSQPHKVDIAAEISCGGVQGSKSQILHDTQRLQRASCEEYPTWHQIWKKVVSWEDSRWGRIYSQAQGDGWSCVSRTPRTRHTLVSSANDSERLKLVYPRNPRGRGKNLRDLQQLLVRWSKEPGQDGNQ